MSNVRGFLYPFEAVGRMVTEMGLFMVVFIMFIQQMSPILSSPWIRRAIISQDYDIYFN